MGIYVFGSLAVDRLQSFGRRFADVILPDHIADLNVCFFIDAMTQRRGGTAGNIAYSLSLLGEKPHILASAGRDFADYAAFIMEHDMPVSGIRILEDEFTAVCTIITDADGNQISSFYPAAMAHTCQPDLSAAGPKDILVLSPGNIEDMRTLPDLCRERGIRLIFDPGQQIPVLSAADLINGIKGSEITITNEYELEMICRTTGRTRAEIRALTGTLITTMGSRGSVLNNGETVIPAVAAREALDPTGAGDSYRSGLVKGLAMGLTIEQAARMGATCAAYCVEHKGTQEHAFTLDEFAARHRAAFHEDLPF